MWDNYGYGHTQRIYNNYCLSTANAVMRTRLNVSLYYTVCLVESYLVLKHHNMVVRCSVYTVVTECARHDVICGTI